MFSVAARGAKSIRVADYSLSITLSNSPGVSLATTSSRGRVSQISITATATVSDTLSLAAHSVHAESSVMPYGLLIIKHSRKAGLAHRPPAMSRKLIRARTHGRPRSKQNHGSYRAAMRRGSGMTKGNRDKRVRKPTVAEPEIVVMPGNPLVIGHAPRARHDLGRLLEQLQRSFQ